MPIEIVEQPPHDKCVCVESFPRPADVFQTAHYVFVFLTQDEQGANDLHAGSFPHFLQNNQINPFYFNRSINTNSDPILNHQFRKFFPINQNQVFEAAWQTLLPPDVKELVVIRRLW